MIYNGAMRPGGGWWFALALVSGCERVLGLAPLPDSPQYPDHFLMDPDGDADGDHIPNSMDLCPVNDDTQGAGGGVDSDKDGVGDLCDPHPDTPGDCLVLFDDFSNETLSPHWIGAGGALQIIQVPGPAGRNVDVLQFDSTPEEIVSLDIPLDLDAVTLLGYVQAGDQSTNFTRAAVEMFVDLTLSRMPTAANGTACAIESMNVPTKVEGIVTTAGLDAPSVSVDVGPERLGAGTNFTLLWSPAAGGCWTHIDDSANQTSDTASVALDVPKSGTFAVRGIGVGLYFYAVAGWGHSCATK